MISRKKKKPFCRTCRTDKSLIHDAKENNIICTSCGIVVSSMTCETMHTTFNESSQFSFTPEHQNLGGFVDKKYKITQLQVNQKTSTKAQNRMKNLTKKLEDIVHRLGCTKRIHDRAVSLMYNILKNEELKRIKKDELLCAVNIIMAAREARIQYTFREIADACENVSKKEICRVYKIYERKLSKSKKKKIDLEKVKFNQMISRFSSVLGLEFLVEKKVRRILNSIEKYSELATLNPTTRLAVSLAMAIKDDEEISNNDVSAVCRVSVHTIEKSTELVNEIFTKYGKKK